MTAIWDDRSAGEHQRVRDLTLRQWLPAACSMSAYWAERAGLLGEEARDLTTVDDLRRFEPVREDHVRGVGGPGGPALLMRPTNDQVKSHGNRSVLLSMASAIRNDGRDGERRAVLQEYKPVHVHRGGAQDDLAIAYSRSDLDRLHRCGARAARVLGLDDADYLVSAVPSGPRLEWWGVHHLAMGASILALHPRGHGDELARVLDSFALLPTTVVAVPLAEAVELPVLMVEYGIDVPRVRTVLTVGPPPTDEDRAAIEDAWRAAGATGDDLVVRALYAPPEARALWAEPRAVPTGLVTYPDLEVLEVVDALSGEVLDGGGDLTLTTAGWNGTALLRFQTGVYVDGIETEPCARTGITAPRIVGEVAPRAWQPDALHPEGFASHVDFRAAGQVLGRTPGIETWRVEVRGRTQRVPHDRVLVEVGGALADEDEQTMRAEFEARSGMPIHDLTVMADPVVVDQRVTQDGSPFVDAR